MIIRDYDGTDLLDAEGNKIGTIEKSFLDENGAIKMVAVKIGGLFAKHRIVPLDSADPSENGITVPYSRDQIVKSPEVESTETLDAGTLDQIRAYYAGDQAAGRDGETGPGAVPVGRPEDTQEEDSRDSEGERGGPSLLDRARGTLSPLPSPMAAAALSENTVVAPAADDRAGAQKSNEEEGDSPTVGNAVRSAGEKIREALPGNDSTKHADETPENSAPESETASPSIRDLGDVIEVPIVEEELVKRPVVEEVLRVRKTQGTETEVVEEDLRKEDVEVTSSNPDVPVHNQVDSETG